MFFRLYKYGDHNGTHVVWFGMYHLSNQSMSYHILIYFKINLNVKQILPKGYQYPMKLHALKNSS